MKLRDLFNRKSDVGLSLGDEREKAKNPTADPLILLTAAMIESDFRREINRGLYARPAWAFHEMARIVSILGDKVRFWRAQIVSCEWKITIAEEAQERNEKADPAAVERAKKCAELLKKRYDTIKNLKKALKHLATARFYGFAILRKNGNMLQIVDPWNAIHNIDWPGGRVPTLDWHFNQEARGTLDFQRMPVMRSGEYMIREFDDSCMIELLRLAFRARAVMDFRERNLEEAAKNQVIILTGAGLPTEGVDRTNLESSLKAARRGESAVIAKGDPNCPTEVHKPDAAKGLPFYNSTLDNIDQMMTKALTGGLLTMLSMPTGIGAGASPEHSKALNALIAEDVGDISELFQEAIDRPELEAAGLLSPGERPLAWFELSIRKEADPNAAADLLTKVRAAGYSTDEAQASEMTGLKLTKDAAAAQPMGGLFNREQPKPAGLDAGFFNLLDKLAKEEGGEDQPDKEWFDRIDEAVRTAPPEAMADMDKLEAYLRERMAKAAEQGAKDGELKNSFDPNQPRDGNGRWSETGDGGISWKTSKGNDVSISEGRMRVAGRDVEYKGYHPLEGMLKKSFDRSKIKTDDFVQVRGTMDMAFPASDVDRLDEGLRRADNWRTKDRETFEKNVPGYSDLRKEIDAEEEHFERQRLAISRSVGIGERKSSRAELESKYPAAAFYIKAESYARASNSDKAAAGREAMKRIKSGENPATVSAEMERKWREATDRASGL